MSENYLIRKKMASKDKLMAPLIRRYLEHNEMHLSADRMKAKMDMLKGRQEAYKLPGEAIKTKVTTMEIEGFYCYTFYPMEAKSHKHIIYFCGGAFYQEATKYHIVFIEALSKRAGVKITLVGYPKVPTFGAEKTYEISDKLYRRILEKKKAEDIIIAGDSSGGAIALTLPQYFRDRNLPKPGGVVVYSPACSIKENCKEAADYQKRDPLIILDSVKIPVKLWTDSSGDIVTDPSEADLTSLPECLIFSGTEEALYPDMRNFAEKVSNSGGKIRYYLYEGMYHDFHLQYMTIAAMDCIKLSCEYIDRDY